MTNLFKKNDNIAVMCPASPAEKGEFDKFISLFSEYNFIISPLCYDKRDNIDIEHAKEIEKYFKEENISGIICARGGYGTIRRLGLLDYDVIKNNAKPIFGLSDITALQMALYKKSNIKSYSGLIMKLDEASDVMLNSFKNIINKQPQKFTDIELIGTTTLEGELIGGNLATLTSLVGTDYLPNFKNKILVLEEIDESPYRIDRMLYQLYHSKTLEGIKGIAFGTFTNCVNLKYPDGKTVWSYIKDFSNQLNCPIAFGMPYGHHSERIIFQFDSNCEIKNNEMLIS